MNTNTTTTTPSGAPKLSRYLQRIEAKRQRRLHPHAATKRAQARNKTMRGDVIRREIAQEAK